MEGKYRVKDTQTDKATLEPGRAPSTDRNSPLPHTLCSQASQLQTVQQVLLWGKM
jgi:hypothetical protein